MVKIFWKIATMEQSVKNIKKFTGWGVYFQISKNNENKKM